MFGGQIDFKKGGPAERDGKPEHGAEHDGESKGDGFHHHEIHEHESGAHSKHTHPDGHEEHVDHGNYEEAVAHEHAQRGGEAPDEGERPMEGGGDADDMPDFSGAYSRG